MSSVVIEEYLARLGFKTDEESWGKFNRHLDMAASRAGAMAASVAGATVAVTATIAKLAQTYSDLYWISQRTGSNVGNLRGYEFAFERIGLSAEQAIQSAEQFAQVLRMSPGIAGILTGRGISTKDPTMALPRYVADLKRRHGEENYYAAAHEAQGLFGVDERTFRQMWMNGEKLIRAREERARRARAAGVDEERFAERSQKFVEKTNDLLAGMNLLLVQTGDKMLPTMTGTVTWLDKMIQLLGEAGKATDNWSSFILTLVAAMLGLKTVGAGISAAGAAAAAAGATGTGAMLGGAGAVLGAPAAAAAAALRGGKMIGLLGVVGAMKSDAEKGHPLRSWLRERLGIEDPKEPAPWQLGGSWEGNRQNTLLRFFMSKGWTKEQATGMIASLQRESKLDPDAFNPRGGGKGARGIAQWRGERQDQFRRMYGKDISHATLMEQAAFHQWELENTEQGAADAIRRARTPGDAARAHSKLFERHGNPAEDERRAALADRWFAGSQLAPTPGANQSVNVTQKTDIHVSATDPREAAQGVVDGQQRVNGDLVRNLKGAVR